MNKKEIYEKIGKLEYNSQWLRERIDTEIGYHVCDVCGHVSAINDHVGVVMSPCYTCEASVRHEGRLT